jgi:hypothetical protein
VEVEDYEVALHIVSAGVGDTIIAERFVHTPDFPGNLHTVGLVESIADVFAFVHRRGAVLSPATRELVRLLEAEKGALGAPL